MSSYFHIREDVNIPEPGKSNNNDRTNVYMIHLSGRLACIRGSIQGPLKPFGPSQHYRIEGLRGALKWAPIMPRDVSMSPAKASFIVLLQLMGYNLAIVALKILQAIRFVYSRNSIDFLLFHTHI